MDPFTAVVGLSALQGAQSTFNTVWQNRQNTELSKYAFRQNKKMWELNNKYNHPSAQMERLKQAGLNPNMMYGQTQSVGNTSSKTPEYTPPEIKSNTDFGNPLDHLAKFQDTRAQLLQMNNLKATNELIKAQAGKAIADSTVAGKRAGLLDQDTTIRKAQAAYAETLSKTQSDTATQTLKNTTTQGQILRIERDIKNEELKLRKMGLSPNDPAWIRQVGDKWKQIMDYGLDEDDLPRRMLDGYREWRRNQSKETRSPQTINDKRR